LCFPLQVSPDGEGGDDGVEGGAGDTGRPPGTLRIQVPGGVDHLRPETPAEVSGRDAEQQADQPDNHAVTPVAIAARRLPAWRLARDGPSG